MSNHGPKRLFTAALFAICCTKLAVGQEPLQQPSIQATNTGAEAKPSNERNTVKNLVGLSFIWIPSARVELGNANLAAEPTGSPEFDEIEKPRTVQLSGFYIQTTETTNAQFKMHCSENKAREAGSNFLKHWYDDNYRDFRSDDCPVVFVNVKDIESYCDWLKLRCGQSYRLPTEDEWEYACKCSGTIVGNKPINPDRIGWFQENSDRHSHRVGSQLPNSFGLFDMQGNVWEWTSTEFDKEIVAKTEFAGRSVLHIKGGGWGNKQKFCTCTSRWAGWPPEYRSSSVGFRLVMVKDEK